MSSTVIYNRPSRWKASHLLLEVFIPVASENMKFVYSLAALAAIALPAVKAQQSNYGQCGGSSWTGMQFDKEPRLQGYLSSH
jgi:hypothetical protein